MITGDNVISDLPSADALRPPAPSAALLSAMRAIEPVRTRVPLRTMAVVVAAACVFPLYAFSAFPLRLDLHHLPPIWVAGIAVLWLAGFTVPLALAVLPRRGQVLPDAGRAGRAALVAGGGLILVGLLLTVDAPGTTILPRTRWDGFLHLWWHCISFGLKVSVPLVIVAAFLLRHVAVVSVARLGAAVGAAGGALAGLTLHGLCPYGGAVHVGLAHGGGVVVGAVIGALWLPVLARLASGRTPRPR